jgi:hypothetical protein
VRVLKISIAFVIVLYLVSLVIFFLTQRRLLYYPNHSHTALTDSHANKVFKEISVRTQDGIDLRAWYAPATRKPFTIVFFHGNADSLDTAAKIADPYIAAGYGFLVAGYRGYSGLQGKPTEIGLYNDACLSAELELSEHSEQTNNSVRTFIGNGGGRANGLGISCRRSDALGTVPFHSEDGTSRFSLFPFDIPGRGSF